ncbi:hypothetical protein PS918_05974 [Pseudomonas fluorescens]|uniref:Uncharacterized protein n=1 Tax=Pseudomonas fluorescens TaxID=294 RepID=A0A5E7UYH9_PSEFL|nr:hypothetical protein PS918_05974 [Pseudomonas fluorescens]
MQHRFCQRQAKALPSRRRDQGIGQGVQGTQGRVRQILFDQLDRRRRWELGTPIRQLLLDVVVRVGEGFDDQHHRVLGGEGLAVGLEQHVDAFAREAGRNVQQFQALAGHLRHGRQAVEINVSLEDVVRAQAHGGQGHSHAVVLQSGGHPAGHAGHQVRLVVEVMAVGLRQAGLFPAIAGHDVQIALHVRDPWRVHQAHHGVRRLFGACVQGRAVWVVQQERLIDRNRPRPFGGAQGDLVTVFGHGLGQFAVHQRQAVGAVEWAFDAVIHRRFWHRYRKLVGRQGDVEFAQESAQAIVEVLVAKLVHALDAVAFHAATQRRVFHDLGDGRRDFVGLGVVQQQAGIAQGVNHVAVGRVVRQHRQAVGHGFDQRHAEAFVFAQRNEQVAAAVQGVEGFIIDLAGQVDEGLDPQLTDARLDLVLVIGHGKTAHEIQLQRHLGAAQQMREGLDQGQLVLVRHDPANEQQRERPRGVVTLRRVRLDALQVHQQRNLCHLVFVIPALEQLLQVLLGVGNTARQPVFPAIDLLPAVGQHWLNDVIGGEQLARGDVVEHHEFALGQITQPGFDRVADAVMHQQRIGAARLVIIDTQHVPGHLL